MRFTSSLVAAIVTGSSLVYAGLEDVKSGVHLTASNFDSSISGKNALVAFYAPWCGHCKSLEPTWEKLAQDFKDEENVLVGQLDADNSANRPVATRYGVKGYPTIKFFPADGSAPLDYQSPRTEDAFIEYINTQAGTHRTAGGLLNDLAGRIPSLDTLAATFLSTSTDARDTVVAQAKELAASLTGSANTAEQSGASYYLKVMEKLNQSNDWAATEVARLQKMASKRGTMAGKQLDDLQIRQNILAAFTAAKASASSILSDASATLANAPSAASASASSLASAAAASAKFGTAAAVAGASKVSASVGSVLNQGAGGIAGGASAVAASANFGTAAAAAGASKVSASVGSAYNEAIAGAGGAAAAASASLDSAASAASGAAQSVVNNVYNAASGVSGQGQASVSSGSVAASSAASSASKSAASAASAASKSGYSAASQASATASSASKQGAASASSVSKQGAASASGASASVKSAASQASASVDSAYSEISSTVSSAYSAASSAASSAGRRVADEL